MAWLWILEVERVLGHRVLRYVEEELLLSTASRCLSRQVKILGDPAGRLR